MEKTMALKFQILNRPNTRKLEPGQTLQEHGITFERLANGDGKFSVNVQIDGVRVHRHLGKESDGVTREQCEQFIEQARTDARQGRLNLPKGRKVALGFREAADQYLQKCQEESGKNLTKKATYLSSYLVPFFKDTPLSQAEYFRGGALQKGAAGVPVPPGWGSGQRSGPSEWGTEGGLGRQGYSRYR
jgi:hypothetical protein